MRSTVLTLLGLACMAIYLNAQSVTFGAMSKIFPHAAPKDVFTLVTNINASPGSASKMNTAVLNFVKCCWGKVVTKTLTPYDIKAYSQQKATAFTAQRAEYPLLWNGLNSSFVKIFGASVMTKLKAQLITQDIRLDNPNFIVGLQTWYTIAYYKAPAAKRGLMQDALNEGLTNYAMKDKLVGFYKLQNWTLYDDAANTYFVNSIQTGTW